MLIKMVAAVDPEAEEAVAHLLMVESSGGVSIEETPGALLISGYVPAERIVTIREDLQRVLLDLAEAGVKTAPGRITEEAVDEREWADVYREHFHVERIGRVVVRPPWESYELQPGEAMVELDPGLAFGTGSHATTKGCLIALQDVMRPGLSVVDVGTGSGILAIAAAKLGASRVLALDTDPIAVDVARRNVEINGESSIVRVEEGELKIARESYDVALANLTAPDVMHIAPELAGVSGLRYAILSGILYDQAERVEEALLKAGFTIDSRHREDGWLTVVVSLA